MVLENRGIDFGCWEKHTVAQKELIGSVRLPFPCQTEDEFLEGDQDSREVKTPSVGIGCRARWVSGQGGFWVG